MLLCLLFCSVFAAHYPVILVPGLTGSQIESRTSESGDWSILWFNSIRSMFETDSYVKDISVNYNAETHEYTSNVFNTRVRDFGGVDGIDHLDSVLTTDTYYFHGLILCLFDFIPSY
jgi:hypothetical protein